MKLLKIISEIKLAKGNDLEIYKAARELKSFYPQVTIHIPSENDFYFPFISLYNNRRNGGLNLNMFTLIFNEGEGRYGINFAPGTRNRYFKKLDNALKYLIDNKKEIDELHLEYNW